MINQRLVGTTPLELSPYPASSYAVSVQQDGYHRWSAGVLVPADKVTRVHARLQKSAEGDRNSRSIGLSIRDDHCD